MQSILILVLLTAIYGVSDAALQVRRVNSGKFSLEESQGQKDARPSLLSLLRGLRGGAGSAFNLDELMKRKAPMVDLTGNVDVLVTTSFGSSFLDKKKRLTVPANSTVFELKLQLSSKFPGSPPVGLQRLFYTSRMLNDSEVLGRTTTLSPIPLVLDMISGTSAYNRTLSIRSSIEAYVSTLVHQAYIGAKMRDQLRPEAQEPTLESPYYSELFRQLNASVYEQYQDDIATALEVEKEPDVRSTDTEAWRGDGVLDQSERPVNPLSAALAKEFDLNWRGLRNFAYYSLVLMAFAYFGASSPSSARLLLSLIPALWLSKLRQLRLLSKIALYLALPTINASDFLRPLLPAPLQVIGAQSAEEGEAEAQANKSPGRSWFGTFKGARKGKYGFSAARRLLKKKIGKKKSKAKKQAPVEAASEESETLKADVTVASGRGSATAGKSRETAARVENALRSAQDELQRLVEDFGRAAVSSAAVLEQEDEVNVDSMEDVEEENEEAGDIEDAVDLESREWEQDDEGEDGGNQDGDQDAGEGDEENRDEEQDELDDGLAEDDGIFDDEADDVGGLDEE